MMKNNFEVLQEHDERGFYHIKVKEGKYEGVVFTLGSAWFEEDGKLSFDYYVVKGKIEEDDQEFAPMVGSYLYEMLLDAAREDNLEN